MAGAIYFAICTNIVADKEKPGETKELLKYDTHGSITIMPTADDNGMDYTCEASHPAIPIDRPMRATITLSVFCKYDRHMYAKEKNALACLPRHVRTLDIVAINTLLSWKKHYTKLKFVITEIIGI